MKTRIIVPAALALIIGASLAGCSNTATTAAAPPAAKTSAPTAAPSQTPSASPSQAPKNPTFGQTAIYSGLNVTVSAPTPFTPSAYASGATSGQPDEEFTITVKNTGTANFDPTLFQTTVTGGGQPGSEVFDTDAGLNGAPSNPVTPGATLSWKVGYSVASTTGLQASIQPDFSYQTVVFGAAQ